MVATGLLGGGGAGGGTAATAAAVAVVGTLPPPLWLYPRVHGVTGEGGPRVARQVVLVPPLRPHAIKDGPPHGLKGHRMAVAVGAEVKVGGLEGGQLGRLDRGDVKHQRLHRPLPMGGRQRIKVHVCVPEGGAEGEGVDAEGDGQLVAAHVHPLNGEGAGGWGRHRAGDAGGGGRPRGRGGQVGHDAVEGSGGK